MDGVSVGRKLSFDVDVAPAAAPAREDDVAAAAATAASVEEAVQKKLRDLAKGIVSGDYCLDSMQAVLLVEEKPQLPIGAKNTLMDAIGIALNRYHNKTATSVDLQTIKSGIGVTDGFAEASLGQMYIQGIGVDQNLSSAFEYFLQAANQESISATLFLGYMFSLKTFKAYSLESAKECCEYAKTLGAVDTLKELIPRFFGLPVEHRNLEIVYLMCNELLDTVYRPYAEYYLGRIQLEGTDSYPADPLAGRLKICTAAKEGLLEATRWLTRADIYTKNYSMSFFENVVLSVRASVDQRKRALEHLQKIYIPNVAKRKMFEKALAIINIFKNPKDHLFFIGSMALKLADRDCYVHGRSLVREAKRLGCTRTLRSSLPVVDENSSLHAPVARTTEVKTQRTGVL